MESFDKNQGIINLLSSPASFPLYSYTFTFVYLAAAFFQLQSKLQVKQNQTQAQGWVADGEGHINYKPD